VRGLHQILPRIRAASENQVCDKSCWFTSTLHLIIDSGQNLGESTQRLAEAEAPSETLEVNEYSQIQHSIIIDVRISRDSSSPIMLISHVHYKTGTVIILQFIA